MDILKDKKIPLKVAIICDDLMIGGWSSLVSIISSLPSRGIEPVVICLFGKGYNAEQLEKQGIKVCCFHMNKFNILWKLFRLAAFLRKEKCAVVHTQLELSHIIGQAAALLAGVKARIMHVHSMTQKTPGLTGCLKSFLVGRVKLVIPVSNGAAEEFKKVYPAYRGKFKVIYNCIDINKFRLSARNSSLKKEDFSIPPEAFTVVTVANMKWEKSHKDIVAAAEILNDENIHFLWVGDGPERNKLEKAIKAKKLEKQFHLPGKRTDVAQILSFCDLFALPSVREAFGICIIESYAAGVPVVTTNIDGISEIAFNNDNAVAVPPENPQKLAEAIRYLKDHPSIRSTMADSAAEFVKRFDTANTLTAYEDAYRDTVRSVS